VAYERTIGLRGVSAFRDVLVAFRVPLVHLAPLCNRRTDKGETIGAAAVAAGINPKLLYLDLVDSLALPDGFRRRMENWRCGSGTFRMNVALSELPDFTALPGRARAEHHASGIVIAPSDARSFGWSCRPIVELVIPSTLDDTLAPRGQHVASLFCQHVAPKLARPASATPGTWRTRLACSSSIGFTQMADNAKGHRPSEHCASEPFSDAEGQGT
jgi:phytoene dehydrogenase-like protein